MPKILKTKTESFQSMICSQKEKVSLGCQLKKRKLIKKLMGKPTKFFNREGENGAYTIVKMVLSTHQMVRQRITVLL